MKEYDYLILGLQRTGTSSLWESLKFHPVIKSSKSKDSSIDYLDSTPPKDYLEKTFNPHTNTKILLDGTPNQITNKPFLEELKKRTNLKCIFTLRNPISRIYSASIYQAVKFFRGERNINKDFIIEKKLDEEKIKNFILTNFLEFEHINEGKKILNENLLILRIEDLKNSNDKICSFLNIEGMGKIKKLNSNNYGYFPFEMINISIEIRELFKKLKNELLEMMYNDQKMIKEEFGTSFDVLDIPSFLKG